MSKTEWAGPRLRLLITFTILGVIAAVIAFPYQFRSQATGIKTGAGLFPTTASHNEELPNYDIRADSAAFEKIAKFRQTNGRSAASVADFREKFARGEKGLRAKVPTLKIEHNPLLQTPEVIATDVKQGKAILARPLGAKRADTFKWFLQENKELIGGEDDQISGLKVFSDYSNPDGKLAFVELEQEIAGIPVFQGYVKAGFNRNGEMIRVVNNFAPGLEYASLKTDFRDPSDAVRTAAASINYELKYEEAGRNAAESTDTKAVFGSGDWATTAEKMYFPVEPSIAVPAWRVLIWDTVNAYYVIVDAESGEVLWRKNITEEQTQSATYQVYTNPNAMINVADNPAPMSPGPVNPVLATQGAILTRTLNTRIGNEGVYTFNNNGWISDGGNTTDGNAVESGLDLVAPDGVDPGSHATGNPSRTFTSLWNPPPGNPAPGDIPSAVEARRGAVIQQFWIMNWYHDELYRLGFTEAARNYQQDNFGRGGIGNDRVSAQGQDSSGTNNANFSAGADGVRGRMQMFVWSGPNPDRDGTADAEIMIHEVTHGTSNRLHGNSSGLVNDMSRGMGEGWSDFYAQALLSEPTDPINGVYALGGYALFQAFGAVGSQNYYYGIRRFPKAVMSSVGGPNNRPHNPLTFADMDQTKMVLTDGAFPAMTGAHISSTADQVHAAGEVWSSTLWEVRARFIQRLGWEVGNRRILQIVTDGMKLAPLNPTFLTERDAIVAGALFSGTAADVADIWAGFAIRGMGASASIQNVGGTSSAGTGTARVTEAFDLPNLIQSPLMTVSDAPGDGDGFPEPGEPLHLTLPLTNNTGQSASNVSVQLVGGQTISYGTIAHGAVASNLFNFTVPTGTPCGSAVTLTFNVSSSLGATSFQRTIIIGSPVTTLSENFDGVSAPALPAGWTAEAIQGGLNFVTATANADSAPNSAYAPEPTTVGGGTNLTSPAVAITTQAGVVSFRHRFDTEAGWDGGVLEFSVNGGAFQDIITGGGTFIENPYNGALGAGTNNPLSNRNAWSGNSNGYITSQVKLPASAEGQSVRLRWRFGSDDNTAGSGPNPGWNIDNVKVFGSFACSFAPGTPVRSRADFDGDGRTDVSVFRPSEGNWYLGRSTAGFTAYTWGFATDQLAPGDYDGDGKTDPAIFRPAAGGGPSFYVLNSSNSTISFIPWGIPGDKPVVADYDGDRKDDAAVFRPSDNTWYIQYSGGGFAQANFGQAGDLQVPGDYDGDGKADVAVYRAGQWYVANSGGTGLSLTTWGFASDKPVPADYDGDNRIDVAIYRPSDGGWYIRRSSDGTVRTVLWGESGDIPVPGDYDGDGSDDPAVYRNGTWYMNRSSQGQTSTVWGFGTDIPIPAKYIP